MKKFDGNIKNIPVLTDEKLTQQLIPARFIPEKQKNLKIRMQFMFLIVQIHLI